MDCKLIHKKPTNILKELYQLRPKDIEIIQNEKRSLDLQISMGREDWENCSAANVDYFPWKIRRSKIQRVEPRAIVNHSQTVGLILWSKNCPCMSSWIFVLLQTSDFSSIFPFVDGGTYDSYFVPVPSLYVGNVCEREIFVSLVRRSADQKELFPGSYIWGNTSKEVYLYLDLI